MSENTSSLFEVAEKIFEIYTAHLVALEVDAKDLYWGDQVKIPRTPAICVEPMEQTLPLITALGQQPRVDITHEVHILLYTAKLTDSQTQRREADAFAEACKDVLHIPNQGLTNLAGTNGVVLSGNVVRTNYGYARRNTLRSTRLVWQGYSRTSIIPVP